MLMTISSESRLLDRIPYMFHMHEATVKFPQRHGVHGVKRVKPSRVSPDHTVGAAPYRCFENRRSVGLGCTGIPLRSSLTEQCLALSCSMLVGTTKCE